MPKGGGKGKSKASPKKSSPKQKKSGEESHNNHLDLGEGLASIDTSGMTLGEVVVKINAQVQKEKRNKREVIRLAENASSGSMLRRPFGLASLDIAIGGGMPTGGSTQLGGKPGIGKNSLGWQAIHTCQQIYGENARIGICSLEGLDKSHARILGAIIPSSEIELEMENLAQIKAGRGPLTETQIKRRTQTIGEIAVVDTGSSEQRLDIVVDLVALNCCHLILLDSLGAVAAKAVVDTPLDRSKQRASNAVVLSDWQRKLYIAFSDPEIGDLNLTAMLMLNQVTAKMRLNPNVPAERQRDWEVSGPHRIRHGKLIDLTITQGSPVERTINGKKVRVGKNVGFEVTKGKHGTHEGGKGELRYLYTTGFDRALDVINVMKSMDMIVSQGQNVDIINSEGEVLIDGLPHGTGLEKLHAEITSNDQLYWLLYYACLHNAGIRCLHRLDKNLGPVF